jgi:hypothetical protein
MSLVDANMVRVLFPPNSPSVLIACKGSLSNINLHAHHNGLTDLGWKYLVRLLFESTY